MSEFVDDIHEEMILEAECADETDGVKHRADQVYRWADAYRDARAEIATARELLGKVRKRSQWFRSDVLGGGELSAKITAFLEGGEG